MSSTEANKAVARRYFYEVFNKVDMATLEAICSPDFVFYRRPILSPLKGSKAIEDWCKCWWDVSPTFTLPWKT